MTFPVVVCLILASVFLLVGLRFAIRAYNLPQGRKLQPSLVAWAAFLVMGLFLVLALLGWNSNHSNIGPSQTEAAPVSTEATVSTPQAPEATSVVPTATVVPATPEVLVGQPAEYYFVPTSTLPSCFSVNGPWLEAFGKGLVYEIDPANTIFDQAAFNYSEVVIVPSSPSDLHSTFEMTGKFVAEQGNIWTCGVVSDPKVQHTILFQSADKKWQDLDKQGLAHPMKVTTPFGTWDYASGERPAWALEADDTNLVCPFTTVSMQNPAGAIQPDGSFVGAPGKAGCDFVAIYPDGQAVRYHDAIDSFPYPAGTRFFLIDKKFTNEEVAKALNVVTVTNSWK